MKFYDLMLRFERAEDGTVAVDWIALTAGALGICLAVIVVFDIASDDYGGEISIAMASEGIRTTD